jgi:hypothetical protein
MCKLLVALSVIFLLSGCSSKPVPLPMPILQADLMRRPCQMQPPVSNADEDLAVDVQNMDCVRQLRLQVYRLQGWARIAARVAP